MCKCTITHTVRVRQITSSAKFKGKPYIWVHSHDSWSLQNPETTGLVGKHVLKEIVGMTDRNTCTGNSSEVKTGRHGMSYV